VVVDLISTDGEQRVKRNLKRKAEQMDTMFSELVRHMREAMEIGRFDGCGETPMEVPAWLSSTR
jgi:Rod binding domain-containing protein